jgi:3-sulfinopropanoyl-CoA desulfinase
MSNGWSLTSEQRELQGRARELARSEIAPRAAEVDQLEEYPWDNVERLREAGFTGLTVPTKFGGPGGSILDAVLVVEEMAKACGVTGRIAVESNLGAISAVMAYGTDAQRAWAAEFVLSGDKPAICISEPDAGSAATTMATTARRVGDGFVLNGSKHWITGGGVSRLHLVFARVIDEDGSDLGVGGFLAVRDETDGLEIGPREPTLGLRGIPEARLFFRDMYVGPDRVLNLPSGWRHGFGDLMNAYNAQRVGAAAVALGLAAGSLDLARDYVLEREQFGRPIAEFQGLQWMLADMDTETEASRSMVYRAAASRGPVGLFPQATLAAQAKIFTSESAIRTVSSALQLYGAAGYSRANPIERMYRDVRMFTIGGGTAQVLRTLVASDLLDRRLPQTRDGYLTATAGSSR